jgi:spermidine/putrescine transport system substrate-binding protein
MTTFHPRQPRRYGRGELLRRGAAGALGLAVAPGLLAACGGSGGSGGSELAVDGIPLSRPDNPVTLPLFDDNPPIAAGLSPEGGPLRVYNWIDYLWKKKLRDFEREFDTKVELTTFYTMDEAIAKIASGSADFDVFFPTPDRLARLAFGKSVQPLNHHYLPNLANVWPAMQDPFYDQGSQYTVPYTVYTTGIGWREDKVDTDPASLANPYDLYWQGPKGKTFLLDDSREAISMALLRRGITDVNTEDEKAVEQAKDDLLELIGAVNVKVSVEDYSRLPEGGAWVHQAWSGSMIAGQWYLPEGTSVDVLRYWFPQDGVGPVGVDQMAVMKGAKNPVLAHQFLNFMLDVDNAYENFAEFNGYQPPLAALDVDRLIADEVVPANLATAIVKESDFVSGVQELELSPDGQVLWQNAWAEFKAGL